MKTKDVIEEGVKDFDKKFCYHDEGSLELNLDIYQKIPELHEFIRSFSKRIIESVSSELIGKDMTTRNWSKYFEGTGFDHNDSNKSIDIKCAYANGYNKAKEEARAKLLTMTKVGGK